MIRTHLAVAVLGILLLVSAVEYKLIFVISTLIATFLPDIDSKFSTVGKHKPLRIIQFFIKHRGILHSFIFLFFITLLLTLFLPIVSLGFFLGYALHIFSDCFTKDGLMPFYPYKGISYGIIKTGGKTENLVFVGLILVNIFLVVWKFGSFL